MRRHFSAMVGLIGVLMLGCTTAGQAQNEFKDINWNHWAYASVMDLSAIGILEGYPGIVGDPMLRYRGNRAMTRYEFAVAMKRILDILGTQHEPRKVSFLETLNREMALVWAEADRYAETAEAVQTKKTTSSVVKAGKVERVQ